MNRPLNLYESLKDLPYANWPSLNKNLALMEKMFFGGILTTAKASMNFKTFSSSHLDKENHLSDNSLFRDTPLKKISTKWL